MNILIAEPLAPAALDLLRAEPGWNVIESNPKEYRAHLAAAEALIVRSAVKVTAEVLREAPNLRVIGRAGVGVDNVDLPAATEHGVLVMNTPGGNAVSVAEHTLALMLAMARAVPQASASTRAGRWEKKKFLGTELRGKTLGVIGLGSIGLDGGLKLDARIQVTAQGVQKMLILGSMPLPTKALPRLPPIPAKVSGYVQNPVIYPNVAALPATTLRWMVEVLLQTPRSVGETVVDQFRQVWNGAKRLVGTQSGWAEGPDRDMR